MITGGLRNKVDRIWETFWTGGITNPLDVIEQFTYLLFIKQLDELEVEVQKSLDKTQALFDSLMQKYFG